MMVTGDFRNSLGPACKRELLREGKQGIFCYDHVPQAKFLFALDFGLQYIILNDPKLDLGWAVLFSGNLLTLTTKKKTLRKPRSTYLRSCSCVPCSGCQYSLRTGLLRNPNS
jgi:hypothetical protein